MKKLLLVPFCCLALAGFAADANYFVDARNGSDENDGLEQSPVKSLAKVCDLINAQNPKASLTTVTVLPGNYGEDEGTDKTMHFKGANGEHDYRILITGVSSSRKILFKARDGKEVTHIVGKKDDEAAANKYGIGPNAIGGVRSDKSAYFAFVDFTFRDCYSAQTEKDTVERGGAANGATLVDCVVSNCVANRGGGLQACTAHRCRITGNRAVTSTQGSAANNSDLSNCLIDHNVGACPLSYPGTTLNCTIVGNTGGSTVFNQASGAQIIYNTLVIGNEKNGAGNVSRTKDTDTNALYFKSIVTQGSKASYSANYCYPDEDCKFDSSADQFNDPENLDYRVVSSSDAVGAGKSEYLKSKLAIPSWIGDTTIRDYAGNEIDLTKETVQAGCYQEVVMLPPTVVIEASADDVEVEGGVIGENEIGDAPIVVTVKRTDRPVLGFALDGEVVTHATSVDLRDLGVKPGERKVLTVAYGTVWYVKQDGGDDGNTGAYPDLAKKTIRAAATHAVTGDTIRVYPGAYGDADGTMIHSAKIDSGTPDVYLRSRVVIADGVTLESVEGAEVTSIVGASDPEPEDDYGSGSNAVRCVLLGENAVLRGFTVIGGRTDISRRTNDKGSPVYDDNCEAAGVYAKGTRASAVEDCVVSNCASGRGAAGMNCRFVRTRILNCLGLDRAPAGRSCAYFGCLIDGCRGGGGGIEQFYDFSSCTFGTNNYANLPATDKTKATAFIYPHEGYPLMNSVILANRIQLGSGAGIALEVSNCVFIAGGGSTDPRTVVPEGYRASCTFLSKADDAGLAADYRPVVGVTTNAILDAVTPEFATDAFGTNDLTGAQRVMNGLQDVGALEGDWRPRYSKDIGRRATVTEASPDVIEQNGKVTIPGGSEVVFTLANTTQDVRDYAFNVAVEGGVLAVSVDGEPVAFESASDIRLSIPTGTHAVSVALAGEATDVATIQSLRSQIGLMMILR